MYSDKNRIKSLLTTAIKEMQLLSAMTEPIKTANDFGLNLIGMTIFRAAGMSLQYITETFVKVRTLSGMKILSNYNNIPWQNVFGMRNFLSHQYVEVDAAGIFSTIKNDIPPLLETTKQIIIDLEAGRYDYLFQ